MNELTVQQNLPMTRLDDSLFAADKCQHYEELAIKLSRSNVIPKQYIGKPTDLFVAMAMGYQLGMPVEQAIQDIAVINGRPTIYGDGLLAVCMNHPQFEDILEEPMKDGDKVVGYRCTVKRINRSPCVREFTLADAKRANLLGKAGPWSQYEARMLQMRSRTLALRDSFADALRGIKSREEVEDYIDGEIIKPTSRTQQLKQDIYDGQASKEDLANDADMACEVSAESSTENGPYNSGLGVGSTRSKAPALHSGSTDASTITEEQLDMICTLITEKAFDDERKAKAMQYFEVAELEELSENKANRFIELLNKTQ